MEVEPQSTTENSPLTPSQPDKPRFSLKNFLNQKLSRKKKLVVLSLVVFVGLAGILVALTSVWLPWVQKISHQLTTKVDTSGDPPGGFTKLEIPQRQPAFFTLKPTTTSLFGILPQETFVLSTREAMNKADLQQLLSTSIPMTIDQVSETEFSLKPNRNFDKNQNVVIQLAGEGKNIGGTTLDRDYSWAFQTQADFQVESTIPGNQETEVPVNAGIEFVFNQDGFEAADDFINVSPSFEYRLETHDQTLAIVPLNPLQPGTLYTVTLKKGFDLKERQDPLEEDVVISFQTQEHSQAQSKAYLSLSDTYLQYTPQDQPQIKVNVRDWDSSTTIQADIYQFASVAAFVESREAVDAAESSWWRYYADRNLASTSGLTKIGSAQLSVQTIAAEPNSVEYLQLPEALPVGLYLVEFTYGDNRKAQAWLQATFLSGYVNVGRKETLVWLNAIDQTSPVQLASLSLIGSNQTFQTNDQGLTQFETPQVLFEGGRHYFEAKTGDDRWVVLPVDPMDQWIGPEEISENDYWSYIYHERRIYKPGDTVNFWGVIRNRETNSAPGAIQVALSKGYYYYNQTEPVEAIATANIQPQANGTFIGQIEIPSNHQGWFNLALMLDATVISQSSINIAEYAKPELKIEISNDKKAIFAGESVNYQVQVAFFDGTPASKMPLNVEGARWNHDLTATLETDGQGRTSYNQPTTYQPDSSYRQYPRYEGVAFYPGTAQDRIAEGYGSVLVFGSQYLMDIDQTQEGSKAKLVATVNQVDLDPLNRGETNEPRGGRAKNVNLQLKIEKTWYEQVEDGTYYDFIEKVTRKKYQYQYRSETITTTSLTTNEQGQIQYEFDMEADKSYRVDLTATDSGNRQENQSAYFYYSSPRNADYLATKPELVLQNPDNLMTLGETVDMELHTNGQLMTTTPNTRILYTIAKEGRQKVFVSNQPTFEFNFGQEHIPNITFGAMVYDGRTYQQAMGECNWRWVCGDYYYSGFRKQLQFNGLNIEYDEKESQLEVKITSQQPKYQPGDTAEISVEVTKNGIPISGATVNLAVVDQALAAIGGVREPSILSSLYTYVPIDMYFMYYSHQILVPDPSQAERGGGGDDTRQIFKDTPYFGSVTTDEAGKATIQFDLPDNITTWLVYAQAVTTSLDAGHSSFSVPATLEFFVTSNFPQSLLTADKAQIALNSFGVGVTEQAAVSYQVLLQKAGQTLKELTKQSNVFSETTVELGQVSAGSYQVISHAKAGTLEDSLLFPLTVQETRRQLTLGEAYSLKKGESLGALETSDLDTTQPILFVVTDAGKGQYYRRLIQFCYRDSNRVERVLARQAAKPLVDKYFDPELCPEGAESISGFQNADGGLGQVKWGGSDLATTVWATYVDQTQFDVESLRTYLNTNVSKSNVTLLEKIQATWALALLGEPQTLKLQALATQATTYSEKVTVALALASVGNTELAREMYWDLLADHAYQRLETIRMEDAQGTMDPINDRYLVDTSQALLLSSLLDFSYAKEMYNYVNQYRTDLEDHLLDLSEVAFIEHALNQLPNEDTRVSLTGGGRQTETTLVRGRGETLELSGAAAGNFDLQVLAGAADIYAQYQLLPSQISAQPPHPAVKVDREYYNTTTKQKIELGSTVNVGDLIRITLRIDVDKDTGPEGLYEVTDVLPSGFRYLDHAYTFGFTDLDYFTSIADQTYQYRFSNGEWWQSYGDRNLVYYARASHVGTFEAEPALIQSQRDLSVFTTSQSGNITIQSLTP